MKPYPVQLEIAGATALWTRPDTLPHPVSYPAPTFSAVKGIFESVLRWKSASVMPTACEICAPLQFHRYAFNYGGPMRKSKLVAMGASQQIFALVLANVCYRLYAEVEHARDAVGGVVTAADTRCSPHAYQDVFNRRLARGRWFHTPCLGWKEFAPSYVGPFRASTSVCADENHLIPSFLRTPFGADAGAPGAHPVFAHQVRIAAGRLNYGSPARA